MTLTKTLTANGSKGHHKFTLNVSEDSTSGNSSFLGFNFQLGLINPGSGWNWYGFDNDVSYRITIGSNIYTGIIPSYDASGTVTLKSGNNIEIQHNSDGTKTINIGFEVIDTSGSPYPPGNANSSDTFTLSVLHKAPIPYAWNITEKASSLSGLTIGQKIVQNLSVVDFKVDVITYDSASLIEGSLYYQNTLISISTTVIYNSTTQKYEITFEDADFGSLGALNIYDHNGYNVFDIKIILKDSTGVTSTTIDYFEVIPYTKPTIEKTSSNIKRKTGGGTTLTDNIALLNFVGSIYTANDVIGNANSQQVQYKIWNGAEPSYNNVSSTLSSGIVTVTDYQLSNILYTKSYDYKIKINDSFMDGDTSDFVKTDKVSTGVSVWSEYKDHVDFLALSKEGIYIYPNVYSSIETIIGIDDDGLRYRKVIDFGTLTTANTTKSVAHGISNLNMIKKTEATAFDSGNRRWFPIPFAPVSQMYSSSSCSIRIDDTNINISSSTDWSSYTAEVTLEYTKLTD